MDVIVYCYWSLDDSDDVDDGGDEVDVTSLAVNQLWGRTTPPTCWWFGSFEVGMAMAVIKVTMMMMIRRCRL